MSLIAGVRSADERRVEKIEPFVGRAAAEYTVFSSDGMWYASWALLPGVVIVIVAGAANARPFAFAAVPFGLAFLYGVVYRLWLRHLYYREASKARGTRVSPLPQVPWNEDRYAQWCQERNVQPLNRVS